MSIPLPGLFVIISLGIAGGWLSRHLWQRSKTIAIYFALQSMILFAVGVFALVHRL